MICWMTLEMIILSEVRQTKTNIISGLYVESKKKRYKRTYLQNKKGLTVIENKPMVTKRRVVEGIN